jgi:hypothetical protein
LTGLKETEPWLDLAGTAGDELASEDGDEFDVDEDRL